jgi:hypothetical protein
VRQVADIVGVTTDQAIEMVTIQPGLLFDTQVGGWVGLALHRLRRLQCQQLYYICMWDILAGAHPHYWDHAPALRPPTFTGLRC